jgi:hypothetical protein
MNESIQYTITPADFLKSVGVSYRQSDNWLGIKVCPFCGGGDKKQTHTFAVHAVDGNYSCLRTKCGVKSSFWNLMLHYGHDPKQYIKRTDKSYRPEKKKVTRFIYGKQNR